MKRFRILPATIVAVLSLLAAGLSVWNARRSQTACHESLANETNRFALFVARLLLPNDDSDKNRAAPHLSRILGSIPSNQPPPLVYAAQVQQDGTLRDFWLRPDAGRFSSKPLPTEPDKALATLSRSENTEAQLLRLSVLIGQGKLKLGFEAPSSPSPSYWPALLIGILGMAAAVFVGLGGKPSTGPAKAILNKALKEAKPELADDTASLESLAQTTGELCRTQAKALEQLAAHLPPAIFNRISAGQSLGGEERAVAVMHVRLSDVADLLASEPTDKVLTLANTYLDAVIDVLTHRGAVIGTITLDGIEAWWGNPDDVVEPEVQACKAAVEIRRNVFDLERRQKTIGHPLAHVSIGIASGRCLLARLGSTRQMRPALVGQAARDALKLATMAGSEEILITQATAMLVQDAGLRLESLSSPDQDSTLWRLLSEKA